MAKNVVQALTGNILTLTVDLSKTFGKSKSGKTVIVATTEGNVSVAGHPDIKFGLNVYK